MAFKGLYCNERVRQMMSSLSRKELALLVTVRPSSSGSMTVDNTDLLVTEVLRHTIVSVSTVNLGDPLLPR